MREIKFRLRDRNNKIVGYEKWYSGSWGSDGYWRAKPCWLYSVDNKYWSPKYIPHRFKEQYTGLKDKNGLTDIYEGDIREYLSSPITPISERQRRDIGVVVFENGRFFIRWKYRPQDLEWLGLCAGRAIGNVWENPELLKEAGA